MEQVDTAYYTEVALNDLVIDERLFWVRGVASERRGTENVALHDGMIEGKTAFILGAPLIIDH
ncbi:hypothetical protein BBC27_05410 [Acidithiobacillus ferrivorans]|uniref:Uncharacterized protein n=1 Tax=Acidithiobacillus ferrivorans TaxID=160808 RepID=A0A1B9C270_9PROT|nr:hypothetical protein [Acidithiobacillus ferrivorans]OCB03970.1 hypothetical protein BBC27_05410 [Acidithiobacillus ferrivorans]